jgi:DNA-directed RNA polymerase subunit RPC12/RpoP
MDEIHYPTWKDVGVPDILASYLKELHVDGILEQLIYEKVFHLSRRLQYVYICSVCGNEHKASKVIDDYPVCEICESRAIHSTQSLRGWNRNHPVGCSNHDSFAQEVLSQMRNNYITYFDRVYQPEEIVSFNWGYNTFSARYAGGEKVEEPTTSKALCKAALLVPFIWDNSFCWKTNTVKSKMKRTSIIPTLYQFMAKE